VGGYRLVTKLSVQHRQAQNRATRTRTMRSSADADRIHPDECN
jgi:hypothetical protein